MTFYWKQSFRFLAAFATLAALAACGGGGGGADGGTSAGSASTATGGQIVATSLASRNTGTTYSLDVYLPPASAGARSGLPVVYMLDGESWFQTLVSDTNATQNRTIVVGIRTMDVRARDYVPENTCTPGGGGNAAFFNFIRQELIPYVEATFGGSPTKRALFGHSHGGTFVIYAMFAEAPDQHTFQAYLASDSALQCVPTPLGEWMRTYAAAYRDLPVRLHHSYVEGGQLGTTESFTTEMRRQNFARITFVAAPYSGTHIGIVPRALAEGVPFAFAGTP